MQISGITDAGEKVVNIVFAAQKFATVCADIDSEAAWTAMTCDEIEVLADLLRACGYDSAARQVIDLHALDDDEGDAHWIGDREA